MTPVARGYVRASSKINHVSIELSSSPQYLGMIVFGRVHRGRYLNEDANFSDMGMALLTLFRLGTNDNIMGIMTDLQVSEPVCSKKAGNCGTIFAIPFVICFVLAVSIVLFNLLTAVVLENWEKISRTKASPRTSSSMNYL